MSRRRGTSGIEWLFFASGCAALIYEVVWFQLLRYVVGGSSVSLAMVLASFMGGMCLGSVLWPRLSSAGWHPLRAYALLEFGIGGFGLAMPWLVPWVSRAYGHVAGIGGASEYVGRATVCALVLMPPAILMGATLPAIARWVASTPRGVGHLGRLYAANTFGAVVGSLSAGFVLLRLYSIGTATWVAVTLNVVVGLISWSLAMRHPYATPAPKRDDTSSRLHMPIVPLIVIGFSGCTALGAQVVWTRSLSLMFAVTVYAFAIILAVFLLGLATGTAIGSGVARRTRHPWFALAMTQAALLLAIPWACWIIGWHAPEWRIPRWLLRPLSRETARFVHDGMRASIAILPATIAWGASFPLAVRAAGWGRGDTGRVTGRVYGANTFGAILGALLATFVGFGVLGSDHTARALVLMAGASAGLTLWAAHRVEGRIRDTRGWPRRSTLDWGSSIEQTVRWYAAILRQAMMTAAPLVSARPAWIGVILLAAVIALVMPGVPNKLLVYGHYRSNYDAQAKDLIVISEGVNAPVAITIDPTGGSRMLHVNGKVVASAYVHDLRLQRMLGHLAAVAHGQPRSVLIVGSGMGTTAGSFVIHPSIERIVICEIEPRVIELAAEHFGELSYNVFDDPRTEVIYDDARHFLATTGETFDIITSDPIHPWVKGASALYSSEYYELLKSRLNPGGVVTQWVPFYETSEQAAKTMMATFADAFGDMTVWHAGKPGIGYDVVMLARPDEAPLDLRAWPDRLDAHSDVQKSLAEVELPSPADLVATFLVDTDSLGDWLGGTTLNRDDNLRLEYQAGLGVTMDVQQKIYNDLRERRRAPAKVFLVPPDLSDAVVRVWQNQLVEQRRAPETAAYILPMVPRGDGDGKEPVNKP